MEHNTLASFLIPNLYLNLPGDTYFMLNLGTQFSAPISQILV